MLYGVYYCIKGREIEESHRTSAPLKLLHELRSTETVPRLEQVDLNRENVIAASQKPPGLPCKAQCCRFRKIDHLINYSTPAGEAKEVDRLGKHHVARSGAQGVPSSV